MRQRIKVQKAVSTDSNEFVDAKKYNRKLQELGRQLVGLIYMLVRNVRLHDPSNTIFDKPLDQLKLCINTIIASEGQLSLQCAGESFYLNNMLLRVALKSADSLRQLSQEFENNDVGGFGLEQMITTDELRNFIYVFRKENEQSGVFRVVSNRKLQAIKLRRFEKLQEILDKDAQLRPAQALPVDRNLDRKRYGLVVYARMVVFVRKLFDGLAGRGPDIPIVKSNSMLQDWVDICLGHKSHFLGANTSADHKDYLCYHSANVAVLSVVFGCELGLSKARLRELGLVALLHDVGKIELSPELLAKQATLTAKERKALARAPLYAVRYLLLTNQLSYRTIQCILVAHNHTVPFGRPVRDHRLRIHHVVPESDVGVFAKIVALTDCFDHLVGHRALEPHLALTVMQTELAYRFEPRMLRLFGRVCEGYTQKTLSQVGTLEIFET